MIKRLFLSIYFSVSLFPAFGQNQKESETPQTLNCSGGLDARLSAGAIISKDGGDFSRVDPYIALDLDQNLYRRCDAKSESPKWFASGIVDVRLTAIPVDNQPVDSKGVSLPVVGQGTEDFLKSKKAATFTTGGYLGIPLGTLSNNLEKVFVGPIVKFGLQSVTNGDQTKRLWNPTDTLYAQWAAGARFGIFEKQSPNFKRAPLVKGYLDIMFGKFQNFEIATYRGTEAVVPATATPKDFDVRKGFRQVYEGRLTIADRFYIGMDVNNGKGRDDMRFLMGITFDSDDLLDLKGVLKPKDHGK